MKGDFSRDTFDSRKHYRAVLLQQGRVQVDADWNEQQAVQAHLAESTARDIIGASGAPAESAGFQIRVQDGKTLLVGAGHFYVDGILCENEAEIAYSTQPDFPGAPDALALLQAANATTAIAYLDVWRRHLTAVDDPAIRETALGGPDTSTRLKTVWQMKILPVRTAGPFGCGEPAPEWDALLAAPNGSLHARAKPTEGAADPCILPPQAGYRRLENQLYRVEVHKSGSLGQASFKWSRDNGAVVTAIEAASGQELTVRDLGPDEALGFSSSQWVEVTTETSELAGLPGRLVQIDTVNPGARTVRLTSAPGPIDLAARPKLRRWDGDGEGVIARPAENDGFLPIEDGIEVRFEPGDYRSGDYWLIPARTALDADTGQIEWPFDRAQPPRGIHHHYARLALLTRNPATNTLTASDCRNLFPSLTGVAALHVVGVNWANDDLVELGRLSSDGLRIVLDGIPARPTPERPTTPDTVDEDTLIVTLEAPLPGVAGAPTGGPLVAVRLPGTIAIRDNLIEWRLTSDSSLGKLLEGPPAERRVRVTLKGHAIWSEEGGRRRYLDGQVLGQPGVRTRAGRAVPRTDLVFPSGSGRQASDFESWLFVPATIVSPRPALTGFTLEPPSLIAGATAQGSLSLSGPAPAGLKIALTRTASTPDPVAELPGEVEVPAGQTFASFAVKTKPNVAGNVFVQAKLDAVSLSASLDVTVVAVSISPPSASLVTGGSQQFTATVTGSADKAVTWRVQGLGSVTPTGLYTAPSTAGTAQIIAQSAADPSKSATANVTIAPKPKETKEFKDIKDKDKEKEKEKERKEKEVEKPVGKLEQLAKEKDRDFIGPVHARAVASASGRRRAFIRPEERPDLTPPPPPKGPTGRGAPRRNGRTR